MKNAFYPHTLLGRQHRTNTAVQSQPIAAMNKPQNTHTHMQCVQFVQSLHPAAGHVDLLVFFVRLQHCWLAGWWAPE